MMAPLSAEIGDAAPWTAPDYLGETGGSSLRDSIYSDAWIVTTTILCLSREPYAIHQENRERTSWKLFFIKDNKREYRSLFILLIFGALQSL